MSASESETPQLPPGLSSVLCTCTDDFLYLDVRGVHLPGKFSEGLAGVLIGGGVDVVLYSQS